MANDEQNPLSNRKNSRKSTDNISQRDQKVIVPKPPSGAKADSLNLSSRRRQFSQEVSSDLRNTLKPQSSRTLVNDNHLDDDLKLILNRENSTDPSDILSTDSSMPSSRPTSSSLSKYTALPKIGTKLSSNQEIVLGMRLPNGKKLSSTFLTNSKVEKVLDFAINELKKENSMIKKMNYTLLKWPNIVINDVNKTIESLKIENKSMLLVIEKRALTVNLKNH